MANREKQNQKERDARKADPRKRMITERRYHARKRGIPFDLKWDDIQIPEYCPVLGYKLEVGSGKKSDYSPSLDRLIPEKGYVKGNVNVVSMKANWIKYNASVEELEKLLTWMKSIKSM